MTSRTRSIHRVKLASDSRLPGHGAFVELAVQRRPAYPEVLGNVLAGVTVRLHALGGGNVLGVDNLAGTSEPGAVSPRSRSLQRGALLSQLTLVFS